MIQQHHIWEYTQNNWKQGFEETFTLMFIVALFIIAETWKQHKSLLMDEWISKMWSKHTVG